MLKLSKRIADRIVKVVIALAITISLYYLSTNSVADFSIIDFRQNVSNFTKQCITKHLYAEYTTSDFTVDLPQTLDFCRP